jgi:2-dehydropantoate 2-reductase
VTVCCGEQATRERTLKIAIMGSGGIGGYYGARLQQGGADVTFIARGEQLKAFRQNGIALEGDRPIHLPTVKATDDPATIGRVDMVIFSVKLRDTESAAKQILPLIGPDTGIISLQNGVTKDDMLAPIVGRQHLLGGAAYIAVSIARPGVIKKAGTNERLAFGEFDNKVSKRAQAFLDACKAGDIEADIPSDISLDLWQKFVIIVTMSSITSAMRSTIGPIRANPHARSFALDLMREVVAVGRAQGIALEADFADKRVAVIDALSPDMRASMSLDLELGRPLELPWLAGAVIDLGSKKGIPTPCCRAVRDILAIYVDGKPA